MIRPCILIVDENTTHQKLASLMANRSGCVSSAVSGVEEAIDHMERGAKVDIVLLDLEIPRAQKALRALRTLLKFRATHRRDFVIIANTAHAMQSDLRECIRLGCDDTLAKPYVSQQFRDIVKKWTETKRQIRLAS
jgi:CheY-like chemotaxis protein